MRTSLALLRHVVHDNSEECEMSFSCQIIKKSQVKLTANNSLMSLMVFSPSFITRR